MKLKKIIAGAIATASLLSVLPMANVTVFNDNYSMTTSAAEYTKGTYESLTYYKYSDHIEITDCNESATNVEIPAKIDGLPVTSIGKSAFGWCYKLLSVQIPDSVTSIGSDAFNSCIKLTYVTLPSALENIGDDAFSGCTSLSSITIPDSVTSIGDSAFDYCDLISVVIPDSVTDMGNCVFYGCRSLESVTLPSSITEIGYGLFYDCESLTNITIPNTVTVIDDSAFESCESLSSVEIPDLVNGIGSRAFMNCTDLTSVSLSTALTSIGESAFRNCTSLESVEIPASVTDVEDTAFRQCVSLTSVLCDGSLTSIGDGVFSGCSNLVSMGNMDDNEKIDISDAYEILYYYAQHAAGKDDYAFSDNLLEEAKMKSAADVDRNASVTLEDAFYVLNYYACCAAGAEFSSMQDSIISMTISDVSATGGTIHVTNNIINGYVETGCGFSIEVWKDGAWEELDMNDNIAFAGAALGVNGSYDKVVDWELEYNALPAGKYRYVKDFDVDYSNYDEDEENPLPAIETEVDYLLTAEFTIE